MINLDAVLPDIERAVADRVESPTLASLDVGQLRDLVYQLVERQHAAHLDPSEHFSFMVNLAAERHADMVAALDHSVQVRAAILEELLTLLQPALTALMSPIVVGTHHNPGKHDERSYHPILRGLELLNGEKNGPVNSGDGADDFWNFARTGQSWWIVALAGDSKSVVDPRYAIAVHSGGYHEHNGDCRSDCVEGGHTFSEVSIVTIGDAAAQIRDNQFQKLLGAIHARLVSLCGKKLTKATSGIWNVAQALEGALETIRTSQ